MPGLVFAGATDGYLRAYDAATAKVVWKDDTVSRRYATTNGTSRAAAWTATARPSQGRACSLRRAGTAPPATATRARATTCCWSTPSMGN